MAAVPAPVTLSDVGYNILAYLERNGIRYRPLNLIQILLTEYCQFIINNNLDLENLCGFLDYYYMGYPMKSLSPSLLRSLDRVWFRSQKQAQDAQNYIKTFICLYNLRRHTTTDIRTL